MILSLKDVHVNYGGVKALKGISLEVAEGSITCLIGANGAGKSTTLRAISGMVPIAAGQIAFQGRRIDGMEPEEVVEAGIAHVPEGKRLFLDMNVRDNLLIGAYLRKGKERIEKDLERICTYFPVLGTAINRPASQMSGGEQQMLAIGRGLMCAPKLLLLDEPSLGLSPLLTQEVGRIIRQIADAGVSILLIEQNASLALKLSQRCYVLETGKIVMAGESAALRSDPHVQRAYLGIDAAEGAQRPPAAESASPVPVREPHPTAPPEAPAAAARTGGAPREKSSDAVPPRPVSPPPIELNRPGRIELSSPARPPRVVFRPRGDSPGRPPENGSRPFGPAARRRTRIVKNVFKPGEK